MRKNLKKTMSVVTVAVVAFACLFLCACQNANFKRKLTLNSDFSGNIVLQMDLSAAPIPDADDASGYDKQAPYYWLNTHGNELAEYLENALRQDDNTKDLGLTVSVDDSEIVWNLTAGGEKDETKMAVSGSEKVMINVPFDDFDDYVNKLTAIAHFGGGIESPKTSGTAITPDPEKGIYWQYCDPGKVDKIVYWEDITPELFIDLESGSVQYHEDGHVGKFLYGAVWTYMINDEYDETTNPNGVFVSKGCNPEQPNYGNNDKANLIDAGTKVTEFSFSFDGYEQVINAKVQERDDYNFNDIYIPLDAYGSFDMPNVTVTNADVSSGAADATAVYNDGTDGTNWYEVTVASDSVGNISAELGEVVATGKTYTKNFTETGSHKVALKEGNVIIAVTVSAEKYWTVTFVANGETVSTVRVKDGEGVPSSQVPAAPSVEGKEFDKWDVSYGNVTGNLTVTAVYKDVAQKPAEKSGCGSEVGTVSGTLGGIALIGLAAVLIRRRKSVSRS